MKPWRVRPLNLPVMLTALAMFATAPASAQCNYTVEIIQAPECPPFGYPPTIGTAINSRGDVVGYYNQCVVGQSHAFLWTKEDGFQPLPPPPGVQFDSMTASDINDSGAIVGSISIYPFGYRGFIFEDGEYTFLEPVYEKALGPWSEATGINEDGIVVGSRSITKDLNPWNAFMWSREDGFTDLGVGSGPSSFATDISNSGNIVGWVGNSTSSIAVGFLYDENGMMELGYIPGGTSSKVRAISEYGTLVGYGADGTDRAVMWSNGLFVFLGSLKGLPLSGALDVSSDGETIVGLSAKTEGNPNILHGFMWQNGVMYDATSLCKLPEPLTITRCNGINSLGYIVGAAHDSQNDVIAVILVPHNVALGDIDIDCRVDFDDMTTLLSRWGDCTNSECPADLDNSGAVDVIDLFILLSNWS